MKNNKFIKLLVSIPVIVICLYFIPVLGIILSLFRCIVYYNRKNEGIGGVLITIGIILYIPKIVSYIIDKFAFSKVDILETILNNEIYVNLFSKANYFIILGVVIIIVKYLFSLIVSHTSNRVNKFLKDYIDETEKNDQKIREKNDLKMQEKRYAHQNTHVVECPHCGHENMFVGPSTTCTFCRSKIEYKG